MKLIKLMRKNLLILLRSRSAASIILLGPLTVMVIAGLAFNTSNPFDLVIGISGDDNTHSVQLFTQALSGQFRLITYDFESSCIESVRSGKVHACLVYPQGLDIQEGHSNVIVIHVDRSRVNIVDLIERTVLNVLGEQTLQITEDITQDLLESIGVIRSQLVSAQIEVLDVTVTKITELSSAITTIQQGVAGINVTYDNRSLSTEGVASSARWVEQSAFALQEQIEVSLDNIDRKGRDLIALNVSDQSNVLGREIRDTVQESSELIQETMTGFTQQRQQLIGTTTMLSFHLDELQDQLRQVRGSLSGITTQLSDQIGYIDSISVSVGEARQTAQEVINQLDALPVDVSSIVRPVSFESREIAMNPSKLNFLFPYLMFVVVMLVGVLLGTLMIIMEKLSPAQFRLFTVPAPYWLIMLSVLLSSLIILLIQIIAIISVIHFVFEIDLLSNVLNVFVVLLLSGFIFTCLGMMVGYLFSTEQTAMLGAISLTTILLIISDFILPMESMPLFMQNLAGFSPFVIGTDMLRRIVLFDAPLQEMMVSLFLLVGYAVILFSAMLVIHNVMRRLYLFTYARKHH